MKLAVTSLLISILTVLLFGCSQSNNSSPLKQENPEPSTDEIVNQDEAPVTNELATPDRVMYQATLTVNWTAMDFPTNYPNRPHFSRLIGASHNEQVVYWEADGQPASRGIELMAEFGELYGLAEYEISPAQENGYSQDIIIGEDIDTGLGQVSVEFEASNTYPLITLFSMLAPSPDWFVGVAGLSLQEEGEWIEQLSVDLPLYDAGTDLGLQYSSPNEDSAEDSLPITLLSSDRIDTDFDEGVHFETGQYIATLSFERIDQSE